MDWMNIVLCFAQLAPAILALVKQIEGLCTTPEAKDALLTQAVTSILQTTNVPDTQTKAIHAFAQQLASWHLQAMAKAK